MPHASCAPVSEYLTCRPPLPHPSLRLIYLSIASTTITITITITFKLHLSPITDPASTIVSASRRLDLRLFNHLALSNPKAVVRGSPYDSPGPPLNTDRNLDFVRLIPHIHLKYLSCSSILPCSFSITSHTPISPWIAPLKAIIRAPQPHSI